MYLAGIDSTGKSQVIKLLTSFFDRRQQSHRFMITAPTGSAAALLSGSTYHSVLGIKKKMSTSAKAVAEIKQHL